MQQGPAEKFQRRGAHSGFGRGIIQKCVCVAEFIFGGLFSTINLLNVKKTTTLDDNLHSTNSIHTLVTFNTLSCYSLLATIISLNIHVVVVVGKMLH